MSGTLFDPVEGEHRRDEAVDRVEVNADPTWLDEACVAIIRVPVGWSFTTDDVWGRLAELGVGAPREPRAMGAAIRWARSEGQIVATGQYQQTARPEAHARPIPIWRRL